MLSQSIINSLRSFVIVIDNMGNIIAVNNAWQRFATDSQRSEEVIEGIGVNYLDVCAIEPETFALGSAEPLAGISRVISGDKDYFWTTFEIKSLKRNMWFLYSAEPMSDRSGVVISYTDISEQKRHELAAIANEKRLNAIFQNAPDGILTVASDFTIESASPAACRIFGYAADELIGQHVHLLIPVSLHTQHHQHIDRYRSNDSRIRIAFDREVMARHKSGVEFPLELAISETLLGDRTIYTVIARDITERHRYLQELKAANENVRSFLAISGAAILRLSRLSTIEVINQRGLELLEYEEKEVLGKNWFEIAVPAADRQELAEAFDTIMCTGELIIDRLRGQMVTKSGRIRTLEWNMCVQRTDTGEISGLLLSGIDITEQTVYEKSLIAAKQAAETANQAKSDFLSSMSHELRTPLNAVIGFSEILGNDAALPDKHRAMVSMMLASARHLLALVNDVLDLSALESGKLAVNIEPVTVDDVINQCKMLTLATASEYHVSVLTSENMLTGVAVLADRRRLVQVLLNLLSNAIKYNRENGKVLLDVTDLGDAIRFRVTDTGIGIPKSKIRQLFRPFDRLGVEKKRIAGTGIGLVITKKMVKAMGGRLSLYSIENKGTAFWIDLPKAEAGNSGVASGYAGIVDTDAIESEVRNNNTDNTSLAIPKILLVEDNSTNQKVISLQLESLGLSTDVADNGQQGYEKWAAGNYHLVLTDIHMPVMDGIGLIRAIRTNEVQREFRTTIIVVTADVMSSELEQALAAGADASMTKPIEMAALKQSISAYIDLSGTAPLATKPRSRKNDVLVDFDILRDMIGDDIDAIKSVLLSFCEQGNSIMAAIAADTSARNGGETRAGAHKLKSSARAIGAKPLADICQTLEGLCEKGNWQLIHEAVQQLARVYNDTMIVLVQQLSSSRQS